MRGYTLITEDDDDDDDDETTRLSTATTTASSSTVWVCARTHPIDDEAWVRLSHTCGRFVSSSSSSRLSCTGLDADSHDARCLIAREASEAALRENLKRMRDEEIDSSYARAEVRWAQRGSAATATRVDVYHTYTPPERRGRGEGRKVVEQLIAWARSAVKAETVVASCSFARRVLDKADDE